MYETAEHGGAAPPRANPPADEARPSDAMLLGRVSRRDRAAFEELFDRFVAPVHGLVHAIVDDADRAAEVVAVLFVDLWRSPSDLLSSPRGASSGVEERILAAAHRRAVQAARRHREDPTSGDPPDQPVPRSAARVLDRLQDPDAVTAMGLAYFGARTTREIAARMEVPMSRVASLLKGGLEELRHRSGAG